MNEAHHVLVQECLQELEVKSTEPDSIIRCSEIKENDARLLTLLERILDVLGEESYLVHGGLPMAEACLLFRQF